MCSIAGRATTRLRVKLRRRGTMMVRFSVEQHENGRARYIPHYVQKQSVCNWGIYNLIKSKDSYINQLTVYGEK